MSIEVQSDVPFSDATFSSKFKAFEINTPLEENIVLHHRFEECRTMPKPKNQVYLKPPWAIYSEIFNNLDAYLSDMEGSSNQMFLCIALSMAGGISRKYFGNEV